MERKNSNEKAETKYLTAEKKWTKQIGQRTINTN